MIIETYNNFKEVFQNKKYLLLTFILFLIFQTIFYIISEYNLIQGNYGTYILYFEIILQLLISILFSMFIVITIYKFNLYNKISFKENSTASIGSFLGILVVGCPGCSITIASYIGLAGLVSYLPYDGFELKVLSVVLLLYAIYLTSRDLKICKIKKRKS